MRRINIAVVDSSYGDRKRTLNLVDEYMKGVRIKAKIEWFNSGQGILNDVEANGSYDLYLIEPVLPDINGINLARQLKKFYEKGMVVFISETESYAFAAFEVRAFDYISKSSNKVRFFKMLDNAIETIINNMVVSVVVLELQTGFVRVPADDISHVDIVGRALCYHMKSGAVHYSKSLRYGFATEVGKLLEHPWFVMSGVSHLLNISCITVLHKTHAIMSNGETVPITHASYPMVRKLWSESKL